MENYDIIFHYDEYLSYNEISNKISKYGYGKFALEILQEFIINFILETFQY